MTIGNLGALRQRNVKRMLAYSSIAHAGYILVAFTALSADGIAAACFYTVAYAAMNVGVFAVVTHAGGYDDHLALIDDYRGLAYRSPLLGGAHGLLPHLAHRNPLHRRLLRQVLRLLRRPPFRDTSGSPIIGLINSGIACFYYLRVATAIYSQTSGRFSINSVPRAISLAAALPCSSPSWPRSSSASFRAESWHMAKAGAATYPSVSAPAPEATAQSTH